MATARQRGPRTTELEELLGTDAMAWLVLDLDGAIVDANDAALAILERSRETMVETGLFTDGWEVDDSDGRPLSPRMWPHARVIATGSAIKGVVVRVRRHGATSPRWLRVNAVPRMQASGKVQRIVVSLQDITASQVHRRPSLQHMLRAVPGGMFRFLRSPSGVEHFVFLNERAAELFGIPIELALTDSSALWNLVAPEDLHEAMQEPSGVWIGDLHVPSMSRTLRCRAVPEQYGNSVIWNGVIWDVTEEYRLRDQLEHASRRETVGDLVAGVSHNFNNVLAAIVPNLEACQKRADQDLLPMIDDALRAARGAQHLVRQLLVTTGRDTKAQRELLDVSTIVSEVAGLCRHSFGDQLQIHLRDMDEKDSFVSARPGDLHQVLLNLCMNARDALTGTVSGRLTIEIARETSREIIIRVADNGHGMSEDTLRHLGEPFFTTKPPGRGTGLGLASAYAIVRELGGDITCDSRLSVGTTFEIRLPRQRVSRVQATPRPIARAVRAAEFGGECALVIDDEPLVRRSLGRQLRSLGFTVLEAASGEQALLTLAEREDIGVVFLDLTLDRMTGADVLAAIRCIHSTLPVFVVTGSSRRPRDLGTANAVLTKPVAYDALCAALFEGLDRRTASLH